LKSIDRPSNFFGGGTAGIMVYPFCAARRIVAIIG
jgi:hypothetical protein